MEPVILNPGQLLVLCILRGQLVAARNIDNYEWTIRHESYFNETCIRPSSFTAISEERKAMNEVKEKIRQVAKDEFPAQEPKMRNFYSRWDGYSYSLADRDEDMSWWDNTLFDNWHYKGKFELKETLSEKEKYILFELLPKVEFKRPDIVSTFAH
jgi:hypothetical protein